MVWRNTIQSTIQIYSLCLGGFSFIRMTLLFSLFDTIKKKKSKRKLMVEFFTLTDTLISVGSHC